MSEADQVVWPDPGTFALEDVHDFLEHDQVMPDLRIRFRSCACASL